MSEYKGVPSFEDFLKAKAGAGAFIGQMPIGEYNMQFLGVTMVPDKFNPGDYKPSYSFNHDGIEKKLESYARTLWDLKGREGQTVKLTITIDPKTTRRAYLVR